MIRTHKKLTDCIKAGEKNKILDSHELLNLSMDATDINRQIKHRHTRMNKCINVQEKIKVSPANMAIKAGVLKK